MRETPATLSARIRPSSVRAVTLMGMAVAVLLVGLLSLVVVPQVKRSIISAKSQAVVRDLRSFQDAMERCVESIGDWPESSTAPGVYPKECEKYLANTRWRQTSPIGGHYLWQNQIRHAGQRVHAAIAITGTKDAPLKVSRKQLEDIDRRIDDGNLATGDFRLGFGDEPVFIIEP